MTTTTHQDAEAVVEIELRIHADGTGELIVADTAEPVGDSRAPCPGQTIPIEAAGLREARREGLEHVQRRAASRNAAIRFDSHDPEGHWRLLMHPTGQVSAYEPTTTAAPPPAARPEPGPAASPPSSSTGPPRPDRQTDPQPDVRTDPEPQPPDAQTPLKSYDSGYVMNTIVPVTRIPRSTRGVRGLLGIGPGKKELAERADRAAACQTYGRPVTIVVADPRGGSGKTTTSVLLGGAFGTARGGGVLVLENHELRGTMHLRTDAGGKDRTIRHLLKAPPIATNDQVLRLGDLSAYVRHQIAGQYDVLVSATKGDRALARTEFESVHDLGARFYEVIIIDTANNESAENWQAALARADSLVVPLKWRNDYSVPAIEMLEELEHSGDPQLIGLVRRAVVVASHNWGDLDNRCRQQLMPYVRERTQAVIEIGPDSHIAEGNVIQHDQLKPETRRQSDRLAAEVAKAIQLGLSSAPATLEGRV